MELFWRKQVACSYAAISGVHQILSNHPENQQEAFQMKVSEVWPGLFFAAVVREVTNGNALAGDTKAKVAELESSSAAVRSMRAFAMQGCSTSVYSCAQFYWEAVVSLSKKLFDMPSLGSSQDRAVWLVVWVTEWTAFLWCSDACEEVLVGSRHWNWNACLQILESQENPSDWVCCEKWVEVWRR